MKKKMGIVIISILCCMVGVTAFFMTRKKKIDYMKMVDEECGFSISQYLDFEKASYKNEDVYEIQFTVKKEYKLDVEHMLASRYNDKLKEGVSPRTRNQSINNIIESGEVKHLYSFFREGKVRDSSGARVLSIEVKFCIVDVGGK